MRKAELKQLPLERLTRGKYQPREDFNKERLQELADSIKSQGLIEPLVVRPKNADDYEIIAGERRWRAAQIAKLDTVPCLINDYSDEQAAAVSLIENIQRQDLNLIEEAKGYQRLTNDFLFYQEEIAKMVGKSRSHIANIMRLLDLDNDVQDALIQNELSFGHAKILITLPPQHQRDISQKVIKNQWTVRKLEAYIKKFKQGGNFTDSKKDKDVERLENLISMQFGAQTEIETGEGNGGWLKLRYFDNDTLAGLLEKIGIKYD
jgi:ParB family transcriptional regulator, chromosome partitioning protein